MKAKPYMLSLKSKKILKALCEGLIVEPIELKIENKEEKLMQRCEILIRELPTLLRIAFIVGLKLFNRLTFLFGFDFKAFHRLETTQKTKYIEKWLNSSFIPMRELTKGYRGVVMLCYFSLPEVWDYITYPAVQHAAEKIKLRQELLQQNIST